jgi:general L-amino acid transport system permease protein
VTFLSLRNAGRTGATAPVLARLDMAVGGHKLVQAILLVGVVALATLLSLNLAANMARVGLTPGFRFLALPANFEIGETLIDYSPQSSFGRAILVGLLNTLLVSALGCLLATIIGVVLGIGRLSSNPLLSGSVHVYVEVVRNTPLLLQLFVWSATFQALPAARQALEPVPGVLLSNRGIFVPALRLEADFGWRSISLVLAASVVLWLVLAKSLADRPQLRRKAGFLVAGLVAAVLVALAAAAGPVIDAPSHKGFNIAGGLSLTTEFAALLVGLVVNAAAGISEIVRSGVLSVRHGQWEAGRAVGLREGQILRLVVLPQALRVMIPLLTSSYLSLAKNSSLAVAIGYPDLVSIANTTANQTGQALEAILIMLGVYLSISLAISAGMNLYNRRHALRRR